MKKKRIKVCKGSTKDYTPVPKITMQGQWLNGLGFSIGDSLDVAYEEERIVILKHTEGGVAGNNGMVAEPALKYGGKRRTLK